MQVLGRWGKDLMERSTSLSDSDSQRGPEGLVPILMGLRFAAAEIDFLVVVCSN